MSNNIAYSIIEATKLTSVGRTTLYAAIKRGELRTRKVGTRTVVLATDLLAWIHSLPVRGVALDAAQSGEAQQ